MKEIKEEIKREVVDTHIHYEAIDGTKFTNKEECQKYEDSAIGVLLAKTTDFTVASDKNGITINLFNDCDENEYRTLLPSSQKDIDVLNQLYLLPRTKDNEVLFTGEDIGKLILMGYRFYNNVLDWTWFHKIDEVINTMTAGKYKLVPTES